MIVAGTGHRPKYCPCKYKENHPWLTKLKYRLIDKIKSDEPELIISGMAIGWDTWLAKAALYMGIPLHAYVPFPESSSHWPKKSRETFDSILEAANEVYYISDSYSPEVFLTRDLAMVKNADIMWALWNPEIESGGTYATIQMAKKEDKDIYNFWRYVDE